jgi:hypothetical protein
LSSNLESFYTREALIPYVSRKHATMRNKREKEPYPLELLYEVVPFDTL